MNASLPLKEDEYLEHCRACLASEQAYSLRQTDQWSHVDKARAHEDWRRFYQTLCPYIDSHSPESVEVQAIMSDHYEIASRFYRPSKDAYIGMGLFYCDNEDMRSFHNGFHPEMAEFLKLAIRTFAEKNL